MIMGKWGLQMGVLLGIPASEWENSGAGVWLGWVRLLNMIWEVGFRMGTEQVSFGITMYSSFRMGRFGVPRWSSPGLDPMGGSRGRSEIGSSLSDAWLPYQASEST
jgi:hypothetical protein